MTMYYDLIASLPYLPHFEYADRSPITPLRLEQRLRRLCPEHAEQLNHARSVVRWRPERLTGHSDRSMSAAFAHLLDTKLSEPLREYVEFRWTQQILLAAMRRKNDGLDAPKDPQALGGGPLAYTLQRNWNAPFFGLKYRFPWLPQAAEKLAASDAIGLERLLLNLNWNWLTRLAEQRVFGFEAVMAYVLKWDMLQAWIGGDPNQAKIRFTNLIDKVTHVENA